MNSDQIAKLKSRRKILQMGSALVGSAVGAGIIAPFFPDALARAATLAWPQAAAPASAADKRAAMRARFAGAPMTSAKLADKITLLAGPGGNVTVLTGSDGKIIVDTFVAPAWPKLKAMLDSMGADPVKFAIDTHWHFDHADNNGPLHAAGATLVAHENTRKRMSESHHLAVLDLDFDPSPVAARPTKTFHDTYKMQANGQNLTLAHLPPAHTDTDIYVHYQEANVLQTGDVFFNGIFPYIDASTGGSLSGMIAADNKLLAVVDNNTKIIPGHGPLGNKADLVKFRDMLSTSHDRLQKLKSSGKTMQECVAAKPFADLDPVWGKGNFNADAFVQIAYPTI